MSRFEGSYATVARREQIITARGERAERGNPNGKPATVAGLNTTENLAEEAGLSERSYRSGHGCRTTRQRLPGGLRKLRGIWPKKHA